MGTTFATSWRSLLDRVRSEAARHPDSTAVESSSGDMTYADLIAAVDQRAAVISDRLQGRERLVALCLDRTPQLIIWLLAILRARAAYLPLDIADPPRRIGVMLAQAAPALIVTDRASRARLPTPAIPVILAEEHQFPPASVPLPNEASPTDLAYVMYTSGSTGQPKGVEIEHGALVSMLDAVSRMALLGPGQRMLATTRIAFDLSVLELLLPLTVGGCVVLADAEDACEPRRLAAFMERFRPDVVQATPSTWSMLVEAGWPAFTPTHLLTGGETLTPTLAAALLPRCGTLWNVYGPTEATIWSTIQRVEDADAPIAVGRAIDVADVALLDPQRRPVALGEEGEIIIAGRILARGYRGDPVRTAERFITLADGRRGYRTGDAGRFDSAGVLYHRGRLDDQVKVRGCRVELGEVESSIASHPQVAWCAVRACEAPNGERLLAAYVITRTAGTVSTRELGDYLRERLPDHMVPARFVAMTRMPLTKNGKIDRAALPDPFLLAATACAAAPVATLDVLGAIWCEILSLPEVSPSDDFFLLGGYSLMTVRLQRRIEERFGRVLELTALMRASTLADMAALIDGADQRASESVVSLARGDGTTNPLFWLDAGPLIGTMARSLGSEALSTLNITHAEERQLAGAPVDIHAVAAILRRRLMHAQPRGAVFLGGWCRWGIVAHEVACQLRERGRSVARLVLLDAEAPHAMPLARLRRWILPREPQTEAPSFSQLVDIAARRHRPRLFAGCALLVRPEGAPRGTAGWRDHVATMTVVRTPGDHLTMLRAPHVATLAATIEKEMRAARRATGMARAETAQLPVRPRYRVPASVPLLATTSEPMRAPVAERTTRLIE